MGRLDGIALIAPVEVPQQLPLLSDQHQFGSGGTGIDAKEAVAPVGFQCFLFHHSTAVAALEFGKFHFVPE